MGIKGICRFFSQRLFEACVIVVLILFLPNLPPYTNFSAQLRVPPAKPLEGKLALNEKLNNVEKWHKGDFIGPEAFADYNGELYVALYGGDIVKLTNNHITHIVKTGKPCKGHHEERICGRPLGMKFDKNGILYVADAYYGIFKVDVKTGEKKLVVSVDQEINGKKPRVPNSIVLASNGDIYWSDSSTEFDLENGIFDLLADPSGRLIHYNAKTKTNKVLIDKLHFANGVALSDDEEFVIVAETCRNRILRYYLKGPKKDTTDIFIDGLPGIPDNLKSDGKGGFLVPLLIAVDADHPFPSQVIGPFPLLRKLVARTLGLTELVFETSNKVYPSEFAQRAVHFIGHFTSAGTLFTPDRVTIVHLDKSGNILDSLHGTNKTIIHHICEIHIFKDTVYLGSPFNDYIARIPLAKIGWDHLKPDRKKREVSAETVTQVPTTTQRPATTRPPTTTTPPPPSTTTARPTTTTARSTTTTTRPTTTTTRPTTTTTRPTATTTRPTTTTASPPSTTTTPATTTAAPKQAPPPPKQNPPTPSKQSPPPNQQAPPQQQVPPPKQQTPPSQKQVPPSSQKPSTQSPPLTKSNPPVAQPIRDQTRTVPVKDSTKTTN